MIRLEFDFSMKNIYVRKKSPLRYLKQKGCTAQPKFPPLWPSVSIDCCCNRSMFSGLLLWIFRGARRRIDWRAVLSSRGRMKAKIKENVSSPSGGIGYDVLNAWTVGKWR